ARSTLMRHRTRALGNPLLHLTSGHSLARCESRAHPSGPPSAIARRLRPGEHRDRRHPPLRQLAREAITVIGMAKEDEHLLRDLVDGLTPGMIFPGARLSRRVLLQPLPRRQRFHSRSSSQAIWIASRIFSFDLLGSSEKPGS